MAFVLFVCAAAAEDSTMWERAAARQASKVRVVLVTQDGEEGLWPDPRLDDTVIGWDIEGAWGAQCGLGAGDVLLVRPDGHIAWCARNGELVLSSVDEVGAHLTGIMSEVLCWEPPPAA